MIVLLLIIIILILLFGAVAVKSAAMKIAAFAAIVVIGGSAMGLIKDAVGETGLIIVLISAPFALALLLWVAVLLEDGVRKSRERAAERERAQRRGLANAARAAKLDEIGKPWRTRWRSSAQALRRELMVSIKQVT